MTYQEQIEHLQTMIQEAKSTVFFGGAGVSTESGVPDFRSASGIYQKEQGAEDILTPRYMKRDPEAFYLFYRKYFILEDIQPNACHKALACLEQEGRLDAVVTQNVDGLHQAAGSKEVHELHGNGERFYCMSCSKPYSVDDVRRSDLVPRCACGGMLRPDIVLYEEGLSDRVITRSASAIQNADLLIIGGTSLRVYPAAGMIHMQKPSGKKVLIDLSSTAGGGVHLFIQKKIGAVFSDLMEAMGFEKSLS